VLRLADEDAALPLESIVEAWDGGLRIYPNAAFSARSDVWALIDAAADGFESLGTLDLEQFKLGACFFSDAVVGTDDVLDYTEEKPSQVRELINVIPLQFEAYRIFAEQLGDQPAFWSDLRRYFVAYVEAMRDEIRIKTDDASWTAYDEADCLRIAADKNGLVRTIAAALCAASGARDKLAALERLLVDLFVAYQMFDDLRDWREDLRTGNISTVLRLACPTRPAPADANAVGRVIFAGGHAQRVLAYGVALLDGAVERAAAAGAHALQPMIAARRRQLVAALDGIGEELRRKPVPQAVTAVPVVDDLPRALHDPLRAGLGFLAHHAARSFWETRHWHKLGDAWGTDQTPVVYGDVFGRAMICDALCDLRDRGVRGLEPFIEHETSYLFGARRTDGLGGWSYLRGLDLLPPDADTTAQVVQALARGARAAEAMRQAKPALELIFARSRADGGYPTWALRPPESSALDRRRHEIIAEALGLEPEADVVANLSYALYVFSCPAYADRVAASAAFVEAAQSASGMWEGTWYEGVFYPTFAALRFLVALRGIAAPAIVSARLGLLAAQRSDGAWGEGGGDSLSTSLAMCALAIAADGAKPDADADAALRRGARALLERCAADGGWEAVPFVRQFQRQANQALASRCITTAFALRALTLPACLRAAAQGNDTVRTRRSLAGERC
jgi:squalene-hopene/tetraprenyl-beta-curcumene cyclase